MSRWVLVDDTDSGIDYVGPWFADKGSQDALGNFGPPYLSTLHGINSPGSFSYTFRGSEFIITITVQFPTVGNVTNPSAQCIIDGQALGSFVYTTADNRVGLCRANGLDDSFHTITVRVDVSDNHTFWLDYVQYIPFPDTPLDTAAIYVDNTDPQINLGGWTLKYPGYITQRTDSTFSFQFYGISLIYVGFYDNSLPMEPTTATYSIDGQEPISFVLDGSSAKDTGVQWSQPLFQTPLLEARTHTLQVFYQGDSSKTPLSSEILEVQNGTNPNPSTPTVSRTFITATINTASPSSSASSSASTIGPSSSSVSGSTTPHISDATPNMASTIQDTTSTVVSSNQNASSSTAPAVTGTAGSSDHSASKNTAPVTVGGVIAGIAILLIVSVSLIIFLRRRRKFRSQSVDFHRAPPSMEHIIQPSVPPNRPISTGSPTLAPLRRPQHYIPPAKEPNFYGSHSNSNLLSSSSGLVSPSASSSGPSTSRSAPPPSHTTSSGHSHDPSIPLRDIDSGVRFHGEDLPILPPGYTMA